ncbi:hypothetical protein [Bradyrhizobium sp. HKCCYLRH3061]|uniref:hypothetical protein n=1 Tax=Bradyrhizobium sp. HKCCYLRH3061 TaxID=3420734 RepID=UPI003EB73255
MCQQWLSIIGLMLDISGFLLIAREWYEMFRRYINERELEISEFYARYFARMEGRSRTEYEMDEDNYSLGRHMGMGLREDVRHRLKLFGFGVVLVVFGFLGQALGSVPGGVPGTGLQSCSTFGFAPPTLSAPAIVSTPSSR